MFNNTFYPTPKELAERIARAVPGNPAPYVLDPSAGKGDLLDAIKKRLTSGWYNRDQRPNLDAVEIVPELHAILEGKGYAVQGDDFLEFHPLTQYTHIVMNPPFDAAEKHLLHAWDILVSGMIICIFPATGLEGKTSLEKQVLALIQNHGGKVEDLGQPFIRAERPTAVRCVLITLEKRAENPLDGLEFTAHNDQGAPDFQASEIGAELVAGGYLERLLAYHDAAVLNYAAHNQALQRLNVYVEPFSRWRNSPLTEADKLDTPPERYNKFVQLMNEAAWRLVLDNPSLSDMITRSARAIVDDLRNRQSRVDFNAENVRRMYAALTARRGEILKAVVLDAFDSMTRWHRDNIEKAEGWLSNEAYRVRPRCILPNTARWSPYSSLYDVDYNASEILDDIDRALCVVTGQRFSEIKRIVEAIKENHGDAPTESTFFGKVRCFQKGTVHLYWRDTKVLEDFNRAAAQGKGWLPPPKTGGFGT